LVNLAGNPRFADVLGGMRRALSEWGRETEDVLPEKLSADEFDRETGDPLANRMRPRRK
jgi:N-sulfoglucosamine sulfohydrolase